MRLGLRGRLILFGTLAAAVLMLLAAVVLHGALSETMRKGFEARLGERAELIASRFVVRSGSVGPGALHYVAPRAGDDFEHIFSGWYWQIGDTATTLRSRSLWDDELTGIREIAPGRFDATGPQGEHLFGVTYQLAIDNGEPLRLQVFGPADPVREELRAFDRSLITLFVSLLLALALVSWLQARIGLRPLARMRAALAQVDEGTRERLDRGYGPDLDPLAQELDELLERNTRIVARARGHAADLAHALKKPLALLRSEADLHTEVDADQVRAQVLGMTRLIDRHLAGAGSGAGERRRVALRARVEALVELMRQLHAARNLTWQIDISAETYWRGEPTDLEEMLGNLLDNAGKWARTQVHVSAVSEAGELRLHVDDDGPGLSPQQYAEGVQRGRRFDEQVEGTGLGLAITRDIAMTYQGQLSLMPSPLGGLRAELRFAA